MKDNDSNNKKQQYDFSNITTEQLEYAVSYYKENEWKSACRGIQCNEHTSKQCPFYNLQCESVSGKELIHNLFKEELQRRKGELYMNKENEMPTLKAGMIVDLEFKGDGKITPYILLEGGKDGALQPIDPRFGCRDSALHEFEVVRIYKNNRKNFNRLFMAGSTEDLEVIWEGVSEEELEKQKKLEELRETIEKSREQIDSIIGSESK